MTTIPKLEKELEQAYKDLNYYKSRNEKLNNQLQQKDNIIKEVKEYIEKFNLEYLHETYEHKLADVLEELLEILDKGE